MQFFSAESREKNESLGVLLHDLQAIHSAMLFWKDIMHSKKYIAGWISKWLGTAVL